MAEPKQGLVAKKISSENGSIGSVPRTVAGGRYEVRELLGSGSFGAVHRGVDKKTGAEVALKFESVRTGMLEGEAAVLRGLQRSAGSGFVRMHFIGVADSIRCMVTDLLEGDLEDRLTASGGTFNVQTTVLLADQILSSMEYLHSVGFVHRDIKPENVMCGTKGRQHHVYLIDFGLADRYFARRRHAPMRHCAFKGTVRYASVNAMRCVSQSRRDDLEAVGYMFVYFLRGVLPWSGLPARDSEDRFRQVREKKARMDMRELCDGLPLAIEQYLTYCRRMEYEERPNYVMLRKLFGDLRQSIADQSGRALDDHELEWIGQPLTDTVPLDLGENVFQPDDEYRMRRGLGLARLCGRGMVSAPESAKALRGSLASAL